jgi:SAM-dependent methyltransferase
MDANPSCPVCAHRQWSVFKSEIFERDHGIFVPYFANRHDALFEVWFKGENEVKLDGAFCENCGFITYLPRPTSEDVSEKYEWLAKHEGKDSEPPIGLEITLDNRRANRLAKKTSRLIPRPRTVLDFGGGDGRLMKSYLDGGAECFLIDYSEKAVDGIVRLGDTLDDVKVDRSFDLIVCSHVLEHLSEPGEVLRRLRQIATDDSFLYCEVPFELSQGLGIRDDPVTHINFFTKETLERLVASERWEPLVSGYFYTTYGTHPMRASFVIAKASNAVSQFDSTKGKPPTWIQVNWFQKMISRKLMFENRFNYLRTLVLTGREGRSHIRNLLAGSSVGRETGE